MKTAVTILALAGTAAYLTSAAVATTPRTDVKFSRAPKGPASAFAAIVHVSAPRSGQRIVLIAPARRIATLPWGKKTSSLLAAPTSGNGFCTSIAGPYGGSQCVPGTSRKPTNRLHAQLTGDASGPIAITGFFFESRGTRLTVAYEDGTRDLIPIFWVSRPISAGLFAFRLPSSHRRVGHRPIKAQLFAPDGQIVSQARVPD
ncbi:MAG TPA: hypothetical protein VMU39_13030 [Solirubrobacteraceae bacterium]|nr:hypothetical protein [Solirubrobacteraceae bacterium]